MKKIMLFTLLALGGCVIKPYVPDIQQGNIVEKKEIEQLAVGMNKDKVKELLGDPVLISTFDRHCLVYAYTNQINGGKIEIKRLRLCFDDNNRLVTIRNEFNDFKK